jgi:hypothetical protein
MVLLLLLFLYVTKLSSLQLFSPNNPKAYCDSSSPHSMCLFENSICYDTLNKSWETLSYPFPHWNGSIILAHGSDSIKNHHCHHPFKPNLTPNLSSMLTASNSIWFPYPTAKLCIWTTHIGHIFLEQLIPTFFLFRRFSLHSSSKIRLLLNYQFDLKWGSNETLYSVIGSLSPGVEIHMMHDFFSNFSSSKHRFLCFEQFLFGTKYTAATFYHPLFSTDIYPNEIQSFRDHILQSNSISLLPLNESQPIFLLEQRRNGRVLLNLNEMVTSLTKTIPNAKLKIVSFADMSFLEQITEVANSNALVTVCGTASHHLMWLRENSVSIEILHPVRKEDVNLYLRKKIDYVTTLSLNSSVAVEDSRESNLIVNLFEWEEALQETLKVLSLE